MMDAEVRRMTELAAKAAGIKIETCTCSAGVFRRVDTRQHWNPYEDDGDSRRLQVELDISVMLDRRPGVPETWRLTTHRLRDTRFPSAMDVVWEGVGEDRAASLRLGVLRIAAEVGRRGVDDGALYED